ncbi:hypothetical protein N7G274_007476 [Stereocaulon virgatum]|uniref:Uncharacterized protein n=1 Tax=Stereocaulon virgatum TaxID=373712 RepID=A0ABR4A5D7_9LECA
MCLTHISVRYEGCGHEETTCYPCDERMNYRLCPHYFNFVDEFSAHQCRKCVEEEARCQEEEARRRELVAAGMAQAARAAEAFNRRMYAGSYRFRPHGEGAAAPEHDSPERQQQNQYQQRVKAGLAQAARAAGALRMRVLREYNFDIQYEGCDGRFTTSSGVESDNGYDEDADEDDDDEMCSLGSPSDSSADSITTDASITFDANPDKFNDEADSDCSHHSDHRSKFASFYDHPFEEPSFKEPPSSNDGQFSEVSSVSLKQGKLDDEDVVCDFRLGILIVK